MTIAWGIVITEGNTVTVRSTEVSSSGSGMVTIPFAAPFVLTANTLYDIWVCGKSANYFSCYHFATPSSLVALMCQADTTATTVTTWADYNPQLSSSLVSITAVPWIRLN